MPILGVSTDNPTTTYSGRSQGAPTYDARQYSHITAVYVPLHGTSKNEPAPPLTTIFTPPPECVNRWMLGEDQTWSRRLEHFATTDDIHFDVQSTTIWNVNFNGTIKDPLFTSCLPYSLAVAYSPGVCPSARTVAEVTAWTEDQSSTTKTYWQASCCRSGMGFGPEFPDLCISTISSPIKVHALMRTTYGTSVSSFYILSLTSKIVSVTTGLALEEPILIAWQNEDVQAFPTEYASSLERRLGVSFPSKTELSSQKTNTETSTQQKKSTTNAGAKIGIGVGVTLAAIFVICAILLFLRHRRKQRGTGLPHDFLKPELDGVEQDIPRKRWHAHIAGLPEADQDHERQELDSKALYAEADGSTERRELAQLLESMASASPVELDTNPLQRSDDQDEFVSRT